MPVKVYHKPVITIWDDEALSGIKARMDYGSYVNPTPLPLGSEDNPFVLGSSGLFERTLAAGDYWIKHAVAGVTRISMTIPAGSTVHVRRGSKDGPIIASKLISSASYSVILHYSRENTYWIHFEYTSGSFYVFCSIRQNSVAIDNSSPYGALWTPTNSDVRPSLFPKVLSKCFLPKGYLPSVRRMLEESVGAQVWDLVVGGAWEQATQSAAEALLEYMASILGTIGKAAGYVAWLKTLRDVGVLFETAMLGTSIDNVGDVYYAGSAKFYNKSVVITTYYSPASSNEISGIYVSEWTDGILRNASGYDDGCFNDNEWDDLDAVLPG